MILPEVRGILGPKLKPSLLFWKNIKIKSIIPIKSLILWKNHVIPISFNIIFCSQVFLLLLPWKSEEQFADFSNFLQKWTFNSMVNCLKWNPFEFRENMQATEPIYVLMLERERERETWKQPQELTDDLSLWSSERDEVKRLISITGTTSLIGDDTGVLLTLPYSSSCLRIYLSGGWL